MTTRLVELVIHPAKLVELVIRTAELVIRTAELAIRTAELMELADPYGGTDGTSDGGTGVIHPAELMELVIHPAELMELVIHPAELVELVIINNPQIQSHSL